MERYLEVKDGLYFPIDSTDWDEMKELAIAKYNELKESKKYPYLRLVCSQYWASEGYWIEFTEQPLHTLDSVVLASINKTDE